MKAARRITLTFIALLAFLCLPAAHIRAEEYVGQEGFDSWYEQCQANARSADHVIGPEGDMKVNGRYLILPNETIGIVPMNVEVTDNIQGGISSFKPTIIQPEQEIVQNNINNVSTLPKSAAPQSTALTKVKTDSMPIPFGARILKHPKDPVMSTEGALSVEFVSLYRNETGHPILISLTGLKNSANISSDGKNSAGYTNFQSLVYIYCKPTFYFLENTYDITIQEDEGSEGSRYSLDELSYARAASPLPTAIYMDGEAHTYVFPNPILKGNYFYKWRLGGSYMYFQDLPKRAETLSVESEGFSASFDDDGNIRLALNARTMVERDAVLLPITTLVLKPIFKTDSKTGCFTVCFDAAGGKIYGQDSYLCETRDKNLKLCIDLDSHVPEREGYSFLGWCTDPLDPENTLVSAADSSWADGDAHVDLYASWEKKPESPSPTPVPTKAPVSTVTPVPTKAPVLTVTPVPTKAPVPTVTPAQKKANTLSVKGKTIKVKALKLKKKKQTFPVSQTMLFADRGEGNCSFVLTSVSKAAYKKYFAVNKKNGKLTLKKKLPKGSYKLKITVKAAGNAAFLPGKRTVTVKVKVK